MNKADALIEYNAGVEDDFQRMVALTVQARGADERALGMALDHPERTDALLSALLAANLATMEAVIQMNRRDAYRESREMGR